MAKSLDTGQQHAAARTHHYKACNGDMFALLDCRMYHQTIDRLGMTKNRPLCSRLGGTLSRPLKMCSAPCHSFVQGCVSMDTLIGAHGSIQITIHHEPVIKRIFCALLVYMDTDNKQPSEIIYHGCIPW